MTMEGKREQGPEAALQLQRMTPSDLDAYVALEKKNESKTYLAAQDRKEAEDEYAQGPMYFIKQGDVVVGAVSYVTEKDGSVYLNGLAIDPDYKGKGMGKKALEKILEEVKSAPRVWLKTHPENKPAIDLYESKGFEKTGEEANFDNTGEPRWIFTRDQSKETYTK